MGGPVEATEGPSASGNGTEGAPESGFLSSSRRLIREGDVVMLYAGFGKVQALVPRRGEQLQSQFGALRHEFVIGQEFGSSVSASKGYLTLLRPTPSLWTQCLSHRTQILYPPDQALILSLLEVGPGRRVAEAGMGTAAFSHSLARALAPSGRLFAFDVDEGRLAKGAAEMARHGLAHLLTARLRNVCEAGFGEEAAGLDGVFLDLPCPWEAVPAAKAALSPKGGRFVSFSPCIGQVEATAEALRSQGFIHVTTVELVPRQKRVGRPLWDDLSSELPQPSHPPPQAKVARSDDGAKDEGQPKEAAEEAEEVPSKAPPAQGPCNWTFPFQQPTHTGYITSATLLPSS